MPTTIRQAKVTHSELAEHAKRRWPEASGLACIAVLPLKLFSMGTHDLCNAGASPARHLKQGLDSHISPTLLPAEQSLWCRCGFLEQLLLGSDVARETSILHKLLRRRFGRESAGRWEDGKTLGCDREAARAFSGKCSEKS